PDAYSIFEKRRLKSKDGRRLSLCCAVPTRVVWRWEQGKARALPTLPLFSSGSGLVSRAPPVQTAMRNCTRDEGRSFEFDNQVLISSHRVLLRSKAVVVNVAEKVGT